MAAGGAARVSRGRGQADGGRGPEVPRGDWVEPGRGKEPGRGRSRPRGGEGPSHGRIKVRAIVLEGTHLDTGGACGSGAGNGGGDRERESKRWLEAWPGPGSPSHVGAGPRRDGAREGGGCTWVGSRTREAAFTQPVSEPQDLMCHPHKWIQSSAAQREGRLLSPTTPGTPQPLTGVVGLLVRQDLHHLFLPEGLRPRHRLWKGKWFNERRLGWWEGPRGGGHTYQPRQPLIRP